MRFQQKYTDTQKKKILNSMAIIVDTREHEGKNDHILNYFDEQKIPWIKRKLNAGDYSFYVPSNPDLGINEDMDFSNDIMVERKKNLEEISGNITAKRPTDKKPGQRICEEFTRAPRNKILLIENASYKKLAEGDYNTELASKAFRAKLFSMWHRYNIPFILMPDDKYTGQYIHTYFYYYLRHLLNERS